MKKIALILAMLALPASAYEYKTGEWLMRGVMGKAIYFAQDNSTDLNGDNILTGVEVEYMIGPKLSVGGALRPLFSPRRVVLGFGAQMKYRFVNKETPLIPFVSLGLVPSVLIPTKTGDKAHFNLGIRPSAGFEYFIARDLAIGIEAAIMPSILFGTWDQSMEASFEVLAGVTWRL